MQPTKTTKLMSQRKHQLWSHCADANEAGSSKRPKTAQEEKDFKKKKHVNIQTVLYAAEKFAADGLQHTINCAAKNDMIYMWYIDRQRAIQCSGFNFVEELPRFLVFLLIMQRLPYTTWGYHPIFEPEGKPLDNGWSPEVKVGDVDFQFEAGKRKTHYGLRGRATNVIPLKSKKLSSFLDKDSQNASQDLVAKVYWPEESRHREDEILRKVQEIAARRREVKDHVPEMAWSHTFDETSTATIREALGILDAEKGSRVLYMIVFRRLSPVTKLSGKEFLNAWWETVQCHRALWEEDVHHRDVAPSNIMIYRNAQGKIFAVLNDFDLSSIFNKLKVKDGPKGHECTGTVPFMAIALLSEEAREDKVEHLYQHDAESFIWVLTWVCLRYGKDGELVSHSKRKPRPLEEWVKVDGEQCLKEKASFLCLERKSERTKPSLWYKDLWDLALVLLRHVFQFYVDDLPPPDLFQTWFEPVPSYL